MRGREEAWHVTPRACPQLLSASVGSEAILGPNGVTAVLPRDSRELWQLVEGVPWLVSACLGWEAARCQTLGSLAWPGG